MRSQRSFLRTLSQVGAALAGLREKSGYPTIKDFVSHHDLPEIQYWRMEKGKANVTLKSLQRILSIHNVTLPEFFCLVEPAENGALRKDSDRSK